MGLESRVDRSKADGVGVTSRGNAGGFAMRGASNGARGGPPTLGESGRGDSGRGVSGRGESGDKEAGGTELRDEELGASEDGAAESRPTTERREACGGGTECREEGGASSCAPECAGEVPSRRVSAGPIESAERMRGRALLGGEGIESGGASAPGEATAFCGTAMPITVPVGARGAPSDSAGNRAALGMSRAGSWDDPPETTTDGGGCDFP